MDSDTAFTKIEMFVRRQIGDAAARTFVTAVQNEDEAVWLVVVAQALDTLALALDVPDFVDKNFSDFKKRRTG